jgi:DNA helicase HerA-like ATPase
MKKSGALITLGKSATSVLQMDLMKLIESRMLTCANSGAGKSTLMRLIVERASGKIPFIILDWEGEFVTLREKFDVVLVSNDGEIPIDLRSAKLLARKLIELHASAVIDLSDLIEPSKKRQYVRDFISSLTTFSLESNNNWN